MCNTHVRDQLPAAITRQQTGNIVSTVMWSRSGAVLLASTMQRDLLLHGEWRSRQHTDQVGRYAANRSPPLLLRLSLNKVLLAAFSVF